MKQSPAVTVSRKHKHTHTPTVGRSRWEIAEASINSCEYFEERIRFGRLPLFVLILLRLDYAGLGLCHIHRTVAHTHTHTHKQTKAMQNMQIQTHNSSAASYHIRIHFLSRVCESLCQSVCV